MTTRYAATTAVPSERSRAEIERTLARYGATAFAYGWSGATAQIMFEIRTPRGTRRIKFTLPMPNRNAREFIYTPGMNKLRSAGAAEAAYDQAVRQRWRALALVIKAKLEAVASGITTMEDEFLAHVMLPDGSTVGEWASPQLALAYEGGAMPPMLPAGRDA